MTQSRRAKALLGVLLATVILPGVACAGRILTLAGEGVVVSGPCDPDQQDPAACFLLESAANAYSVGGDAGWTIEFSGELVPNPDNPYPFPTYIGSGTWTFAKSGDAIGGSWTNLFFPPAPPLGCDPPFVGDADCYDAYGLSMLRYVLDPSAGLGAYAGLGGRIRSQLVVLTGFPPGNLPPDVPSAYSERGRIHLAERGSAALLGLGLMFLWRRRSLPRSARS